MDRVPATLGELKMQYIKMAKMYHPDNKEEGSKDHFQMLTQAYHHLYQQVNQENPGQPQPTM
jgi:DnaJ-class molecular chaperone